MSVEHRETACTSRLAVRLQLARQFGPVSRTGGELPTLTGLGGRRGRRNGPAAASQGRPRGRRRGCGRGGRRRPGRSRWLSGWSRPGRRRRRFRGLRRRWLGWHRSRRPGGRGCGLLRRPRRSRCAAGGGYGRCGWHGRPGLAAGNDNRRRGPGAKIQDSNGCSPTHHGVQRRVWRWLRDRWDVLRDRAAAPTTGGRNGHADGKQQHGNGSAERTSQHAGGQSARAQRQAQNPNHVCPAAVPGVKSGPLPCDAAVMDLLSPGEAARRRHRGLTDVAGPSVCPGSQRAGTRRGRPRAAARRRPALPRPPGAPAAPRSPPGTAHSENPSPKAR